MQKSLTHFLIFTAFLFGIGFFALVPKVNAGIADNIHGSAWSSNIGWISFNCTDGGGNNANVCGASNYGVSWDKSSKKVSGYAWSDNIGWISFNASEIGTCPASGCTTQASISMNTNGTGTMSGWARACSVFASGCSGSLSVNSGGWDGWINFNNVTIGAPANNEHPFGGTASGSVVVGTVDMQGVYLSNDDKPTIILTATPNVVAEGKTTKLEWDISTQLDLKKCSFGNFPTGTTMTATGTTTATVISDTTYSIICQTTGQNYVEANATVAVFRASLNGPGCVDKNTAPTLTWTAPSADSCVAGWDNQSKTIPGSETLSAISSAKTYSMTCKNTTVTPNVSIDVSKTVEICKPDFNIFPVQSDAKMMKSGADGITENRVRVRVVWVAGYTGAITLSASPDMIDAKATTYTFYTASTGGSVVTSLSHNGQAEQSVYLEVKTQGGVPTQTTNGYTVTIKGATADIGEKTKEIKLQSDQRKINPFYIEF